MVSLFALWACGFRSVLSVFVGKIAGVGQAIRAGPRFPRKGIVVTAVVEGPSTVAQPVAELLVAGVQPGSVVVAQTSTGPVAGWLVAEETQADAGERRCAVVGLEGESVVAAGPVSEVMVSGSPMPTNDVMLMWAPALAGAFWGQLGRRGPSVTRRARR